MHLGDQRAGRVERAAGPRSSASRRTAGDTPCAEKITTAPGRHVRQLVDEHRALLRAGRRRRGGCARSRAARRPARRNTCSAMSTMSMARSTPAQKPRGAASAAMRESVSSGGSRRPRSASSPATLPDAARARRNALDQRFRNSGGRLSRNARIPSSASARAISEPDSAPRSPRQRPLAGVRLAIAQRALPRSRRTAGLRAGIGARNSRTPSRSVPARTCGSRARSRARSRRRTPRRRAPTRSHAPSRRAPAAARLRRAGSSPA